MAEDSYVERVSAADYPLWHGGEPLVGQLDVELTERCNCNCTHCYINLPENDAPSQSRELSSGEWRDILLQAAGLGCLDVRFTGGEPLLRDDFRDLYLFARRLGMRVYIFTNATLLDMEWARTLVEVPPLHPVEVTVYGMSRKSCEAVTRTPGSFEAAFRGMELLREHSVPFVVKWADLPANRGEYEQFRDWAARLPAMDEPPSRTLVYDLRARRDSDARNRLIESLRRSPKDIALAAVGDEAERGGLVDYCTRLSGPQGDRLFCCGAGLGTAAVDAYGFYQPCLTLRHRDTTYNLREGSLRDAVTRFAAGVRELRAHDPDYLKRCAKCFLKGLCEQCPAKSWMEHGTLDTPVDYLCGVAHAQARRLGLLEPGEKGWTVRNWRERLERLGAPLEAGR